MIDDGSPWLDDVVDNDSTLLGVFFYKDIFNCVCVFCLFDYLLFSWMINHCKHSQWKERLPDSEVLTPPAACHIHQVRDVGKSLLTPLSPSTRAHVTLPEGSSLQSYPPHVHGM